eukprot:scaffold131_cov335-Pavlova_lutheri.AAC.12
MPRSSRVSDDTYTLGSVEREGFYQGRITSALDQMASHEHQMECKDSPCDDLLPQHSKCEVERRQ